MVKYSKRILFGKAHAELMREFKKGEPITFDTATKVLKMKRYDVERILEELIILGCVRKTRTYDHKRVWVKA